MSVVPATMNEQRTYAGGNEVFFSFLQTVQAGIDRGTLSQATYEELVREWGRTLAQRAKLPQSLGPALNRLSDVLSTLGLVRVFEPDGSTNGAQRILVLRCLAGRYLDAPRTRRRLPRQPCLVRLLVEGALQAAGIGRQVVESKAGMLRSDECVLTVSGRGQP